LPLSPYNQCFQNSSVAEYQACTCFEVDVFKLTLLTQGSFYTWASFTFSISHLFLFSFFFQVSLAVCFILMFGNSMLLTSYYAASLIVIWVSCLRKKS